MKVPGLRRRGAEPDVAGDADGSDGEWAAVRDPALGAWQITVMRRIVWAVMAAALPVSMIAAGMAVWGALRAGNAESDVAELASQPPAAWASDGDTVAGLAADRIAEAFGLVVAADIDTAAQAEQAGFSPSDGLFVGGPPSGGALLDARRDWAEMFVLPSAERHAFLVRDLDDPDRALEVLSFVVSDGGAVGWPLVAPLPFDPDSAEDDEDGEEGEDGGEDSDISDAVPLFELRPRGLRSAGYDHAAEVLGIAGGAGQPTLCGIGAASENAPSAPGLSRALEEWAQAYTKGDIESLRRIAQEGTEPSVYSRAGYRYRIGSLRLLCATQSEAGSEGIAQVWWLAERSDDPDIAIPEARDVRIANAAGLWAVTDPAPMFGHPPPIDPALLLQ